jgi:hypothetical protein
MFKVDILGVNLPIGDHYGVLLITRRIGVLHLLRIHQRLS